MIEPLKSLKDKIMETATSIRSKRKERREAEADRIIASIPPKKSKVATKKTKEQKYGKKIKK